ncbi:unnamed protein product [Amoebophrya sp. A25]|nr:unnamed protein product [Amoebophrya sp. A25]|eukprot:GSA25T00025799001.1
MLNDTDDHFEDVSCLDEELSRAVDELETFFDAFAASSGSNTTTSKKARLSKEPQRNDADDTQHTSTGEDSSSAVDDSSWVHILPPSILKIAEAERDLCGSVITCLLKDNVILDANVKGYDEVVRRLVREIQRLRGECARLEARGEQLQSLCLYFSQQHNEESGPAGQATIRELEAKITKAEVEKAKMLDVIQEAAKQLDEEEKTRGATLAALEEENQLLRKYVYQDVSRLGPVSGIRERHVDMESCGSTPITKEICVQLEDEVAHAVADEDATSTSLTSRSPSRTFAASSTSSSAVDMTSSSPSTSGSAVSATSCTSKGPSTSAPIVVVLPASTEQDEDGDPYCSGETPGVHEQQLGDNHRTSEDQQDILEHPMPEEVDDVDVVELQDVTSIRHTSTSTSSEEDLQDTGSVATSVSPSPKSVSRLKGNTGGYSSPTSPNASSGAPFALPCQRLFLASADGERFFDSADAAASSCSQRPISSTSSCSSIGTRKSKGTSSSCTTRTTSDEKDEHGGHASSSREATSSTSAATTKTLTTTTSSHDVSPRSREKRSPRTREKRTRREGQLVSLSPSSDEDEEVLVGGDDAHAPETNGDDDPPETDEPASSPELKEADQEALLQHLFDRHDPVGSQDEGSLQE